MILSDSSIRYNRVNGFLDVTPWNDEYVQPASIDLTLSPLLSRPQKDCRVVDPRNPHQGSMVPFAMGAASREYWIDPGEFLLASTVESVTLSPQMAARVEGKSSLGRLGLAVHITAGFIDPGWSGPLTLELFNTAPYSIILYQNMKICQISFHPVVGEVERPYGHPELGSKYNDAKPGDGPQSSRYHMNERGICAPLPAMQRHDDRG